MITTVPLSATAFDSRKMLALDSRIAGALTRIADARTSFVTRIDMNLFRFHSLSKQSRPTRNDSYTNTTTLMRMISVVMQDVQQRNLNAKHVAAAVTNKRDESPSTTTAAKRENDTVTNALATAECGQLSDAVYIGLNRSCSQRKTLELCCSLNCRDDHFARDVVILADFCSTFRTIHRDAERAIIYAVTNRQQLGDALLAIHQLPQLIFVSAKNMVYRESNDPFVFVANFIMYHAFHESDRSFDERRFGARFRHMRALIFLAGVVNAELLRVAAAKRLNNTNLALNIQSLGKAYDDVGLHVFAENSIQQMRKIVHDREDARRKSFDTNGLLVNRYLGRVSQVGINAVPLTVQL